MPAIGHFVIPHADVVAQLRAKAGRVPVDELSQELRRSDSSGWSVTTYLRLLEHGLDVTCGTAPESGLVNICETRSLGARMWSADRFLVAIRGDAYRTRMAEFWISQSPTRPVTPVADWVWYWPQPGLKPRDADRGSRVERVSCKAVLRNLDPAFRDDAFQTALAERGLTYETPASEKSGDLQAFWRDYGTTDVVLAVRNMTAYDATGKPPSKLVNAWHAGVPALLGPEPAFETLRRSPLDFLTVRAPDEALDALDRLRGDPTLYADMVRNGRARAAEFTDAAVAAQWRRLLEGPVADAFARWRAAPAWRRRLTFPFRLAEDRAAWRLHRYRVRNGPRILDAAA